MAKKQAPDDHEPDAGVNNTPPREGSRCECPASPNPHTHEAEGARDLADGEDA
jgi:hypothetical protein